MKDKHFIDWENEVFGYGYGTGELHTLRVLKKFFSAVPKEGNYDFEKMEKALGPQQFWLLLNTLCHADIIEYGTSPRYGWLTEKGQILLDYLAPLSIKELYEMVGVDDTYIYCYNGVCNCEEPCNNPLFRKAIK